MSTLVVFYSLEGNTKYISEIIAKELNTDLLEIKTKMAYPTQGFKKYFWGVKSIIFKETPKFTNLNIDLSGYSNIILGTPIWGGTYAAPFNTFLKQYKFKGKKVALFACCGGGGTEKSFKSFKDILWDNEFVGDTSFVEPLRNKEESKKKAVEWAKSLEF